MIHSTVKILLAFLAAGIFTLRFQIDSLDYNSHAKVIHFLRAVDRNMRFNEYEKAEKAGQAGLIHLKEAKNQLRSLASHTQSYEIIFSDFTTQLGWNAYLNGHKEQAKNYWEMGLETKPTCGTMIGLADMWMQAGHYQKARLLLVDNLDHHFKVFIAQQHCRAEAASRLARIAREQHDPEQAIMYARRGKTMFAKHVGSHFELALAHAEVGAWAAAFDVLSTPWANKQPVLIQLKAELHMRMGKPKRAFAVLAEHYEPADHEHIVGRAKIELMAGAGIGALRELDKIPEPRRSAPDIQTLFGEAFIAAKDYKRASSVYEALAKTPSDPADWIIGKSKSYEGLGLLEKAKRTLEDALKTHPEQSFRSNALWRAHGALLGRLNMTKQARRSYENAIATLPRDGQAQAELGTLLARNGQCKKALPYLRDARKLRIKKSQALAKLRMCSQ